MSFWNTVLYQPVSSLSNGKKVHIGTQDTTTELQNFSLLWVNETTVSNIIETGLALNTKFIYKDCSTINYHLPGFKEVVVLQTEYTENNTHDEIPVKKKKNQ